MKFEYDKTVEEVRKPVAWLYRMEGSFDPDDLALCITATGNESFIWMYSDGDITIQQTKPSGEALKVFYEGDSLTLTF